uniref:Uncharacterized protein n=1 Tax=Lactuca sativa TaxID=4236 RepID=A0A9R1UDZ8_LACSA|nr:hypothetical protein LSAT_V11C900498260 [Lactuca sativa]
MESVESNPKAYLTKICTKDVVLRYMNTYKIPNVHTKEKKEEIQSVIRELEFAMEFCIDRMVNDFDKLILFRDEMSEKMTKVLKNKKKITKGKKEIVADKAKKGERKCHKCGKYIKYGTSEKHDARNCHKFTIEGATSNV